MRHSTYKAEMTDRPDYWSSERGYFSQVPAIAPTATKPPPSQTPWYQRLTEALAPIATTALNVYQQAQLDKMNRKRLEQGLDPISAAQYRAATGPTVSAEVGLAPATRNLLLWGGLGLAAVLILPRLLKR